MMVCENEINTKMPEENRDHDLLIEINVLVKQIKESLTDHTAKFKDVETRLARLENWRYYIVGISATLGVIATYAVQILK